MKRARGRFTLVALVVAVAACGTVGLSAAAFTSTPSRSTASFTTVADWVAPAVTLVAPADGAVTNDATPDLSGAAGAAAGDAPAVTAELFAGAAPAGTAAQTIPVTRSGATWAATAAALADGTYTARARQADSAGNAGTSAAHTFTVDTVAPRAVDVQAANGTGGTAGRLDAGDRLTLSFSEAVDPATVLAGWSGGAQPAQVRVTSAGSADTLTVLDGAGAAVVKLGSVALAAKYVTATVVFAATLARNGADVVVTLGAPAVPGDVRKQAAKAQSMTWTPVAGPRDPAGNALALIPPTVSETGTLDLDF